MSTRSRAGAPRSRAPRLSPVGRRCARAGCLAVMMALGACQGENSPPATDTDAPAQPPQPGAWDGPRFVRLTDDITGVRVDVPAEGFTATWRHWSPALPETKFRHELMIAGVDGQPAVSVEVYDNPRRLILMDWYEDHFIDGWKAERTLGMARHDRLEADILLADRPAGPGFHARRDVLFQVEGRVYRVICTDADEPINLEILDEVIESFELGGGR